MKFRRISLRQLPHTDVNSKDGFAYKDLLKIQYGKGKPEGVTIAEIRKTLALLDSLEAAKDYWDLSEEDHKTLVKALHTERWSRVTKNLVTFIDDIENAPEVES
jgi:DNA-binding transcriptional MerR regulator